MLGRKIFSFGSTKPSATPWRWGRSQSLKRWRTFTPWHGCLSDNILLKENFRPNFNNINSMYVHLTDKGYMFPLSTKAL